jgi:hypothetical protein
MAELALVREAGARGDFRQGEVAAPLQELLGPLDAAGDDVLGPNPTVTLVANSRLWPIGRSLGMMGTPAKGKPTRSRIRHQCQSWVKAKFSTA